MVKLNFSFGGRRSPLALGALPPELVMRLRAGDKLTEEDWAVLRAAAGQEGSLEAKLFETLLASGFFKDATVPSESSSEQTADGTTVISGPTRTLEWRHDAGAKQDSAPARPRTYYEALSGRRDPAAEYFVKARRAMHLLLTVLAIGLPVGLTLLAIAVGESLETIVFVAIGASVVGVMIKSTFPRTPFD